MIALNVIHLIFVFLNQQNPLILAFAKIIITKEKIFNNVNPAMHPGF